MSRRFQPPVSIQLADASAERVRRNHEERIRELQGSQVVSGRLILDVVLADGVVTPISHGLGRRAVVILSPPRGSGMTTGRIQEIRTGDHAPEQYVVLRADGFGMSITIDAWVF